jgi:hypothetical protein
MRTLRGTYVDDAHHGEQNCWACTILIKKALEWLWQELPEYPSIQFDETNFTSTASEDHFTLFHQLPPKVRIKC